MIRIVETGTEKIVHASIHDGKTRAVYHLHVKDTYDQRTGRPNQSPSGLENEPESGT
jgi:hypothetical protein